MRPLVTKLQGKLAEVYFWCKKIETIIYIHNKTIENTGERFQLVYVGTDENQPRLFRTADTSE